MGSLGIKCRSDSSLTSIPSLADPQRCKSTGGAGFRLDAVKHLDHRFLSEFVGASLQQQPAPTYLAAYRFKLLVISLGGTVCSLSQSFGAGTQEN